MSLQDGTAAFGQLLLGSLFDIAPICLSYLGPFYVSNSSPSIAVRHKFTTQLAPSMKRSVLVLGFRGGPQYVSRISRQTSSERSPSLLTDYNNKCQLHNSFTTAVNKAEVDRIAGTKATSLETDQQLCLEVYVT